MLEQPFCVKSNAYMHAQVEGSPVETSSPAEADEEADDKLFKRSKLHRSMDIEEERELFAALSLLSGKSNVNKARSTFPLHACVLRGCCVLCVHHKARIVWASHNNAPGYAGFFECARTQTQRFQIATHWFFLRRLTFLFRVCEQNVHTSWASPTHLNYCRWCASTTRLFQCPCRSTKLPCLSCLHHLRWTVVATCLVRLSSGFVWKNLTR